LCSFRYLLMTFFSKIVNIPICVNNGIFYKFLSFWAMTGSVYDSYIKPVLVPNAIYEWFLWWWTRFNTILWCVQRFISYHSECICGKYKYLKSLELHFHYSEPKASLAEQIHSRIDSGDKLCSFEISPPISEMDASQLLRRYWDL
jgi:hypothetical protein